MFSAAQLRGVWAACLLLPFHVGALEPHELLLAVNQNSPRSLELANRYAALRGVPPENIVYLDLPASVLAPVAAVSSNEFARHIWQPLEAALRERRLLGRVLGVAYSCDFPVRVSTAPELSLTGATFVRGQFPAADLVATGLYASAFFAGPTRPAGAVAPSRSLGWFRDAVPPPRLLPLPAMLLGYAGARGLEPREIFEGLEKAGQPFARPWQGAFFLHASDDVRSKMRDWQFAAVRDELAALGAPACLTNAPPGAGAPVLGFMTGAARPAPPQGRFASGAYADHCTSYAAYFHGSDQTKLTLWLRAGAACSAGTVAEPLAIWTKFPGARFFVHQVNGCSALECFALSVRCPLQLLPVGDPLAAPGAPQFSARLVLQTGGPRCGAQLILSGAPTNPPPRYSFFLDGREAAHASLRSGIVFDTAKLPEGYHRLRGVATCGDTLRFSAQAGAGFVWNPGGKMPVLYGLAAGARISSTNVLQVQITAPIAAREVGLLQGERLLVRGPARNLTLDPARLGAGPVELQPVAWSLDGTASRGEPVAFEVVTVAPAAEPEHFQALEKFSANFPNLGKLETNAAGACAFSTTNACALAAGPAAAVRELAVTLTPTESSLVAWARAGLAFNVRDESNFDFFGLNGEAGGWVLAQVRAGSFHVVAERGRPVRAGQDYRVGVRAGARGVECLVNREQLFEGAGVQLGKAAFGIAVSGAGAAFSRLQSWPAGLRP
jgi:hypothetical protein